MINYIKTNAAFTLQALSLMVLVVIIEDRDIAASLVFSFGALTMIAKYVGVRLTLPSNITVVNHRPSSDDG